MKNFLTIGSIVISIGASLAALYFSYESNQLASKASETATEANETASKANKIASKANDIATEQSSIAKSTLEESQAFNIITAENQWNSALSAYEEIDDQLLEWEKLNQLERKGSPIESVPIQDLKPKIIEDKNTTYPKEIIKLYHKRSVRYFSLLNMANQYAPFKARLAQDFFAIAPPPPKLPSGTIFHGTGHFFRGTGTIFTK